MILEIFVTRLVAQDLSCERGGRQVFSGLSFAVAEGEGLSLTGPNGSGKTSLLRLIAGFLTPAAGSIQLEGQDDELTIGQYCHYVGHLDGLKHAMSVAENLEFWAEYLGQGSVTEALEAFELERLRDLPAALLSAGQKRRLALARLVLIPRPVWLLDEPSVSLDRRSVKKLTQLMGRHLKAGGIVLASSHTDMGLKFTHRLDLGELAS